MRQSTEPWPNSNNALHEMGVRELRPRRSDTVRPVITTRGGTEPRPFQHSMLLICSRWSFVCMLPKIPRTACAGPAGRGAAGCECSRSRWRAAATRRAVGRLTPPGSAHTHTHYHTRYHIHYHTRYHHTRYHTHRRHLLPKPSLTESSAGAIII